MSRLLSPSELIAQAKQPRTRRIAQRVVSPDDSVSLQLAYENYHDIDDQRCADPFDILAAIEEEQGYPLNPS